MSRPSTPSVPNSHPKARYIMLGGFLGATGLQPQDLRQAAGNPDIALHVLDYLLEDDQRVLEAAADLQVVPGDLLQARTALAGPGSYGWEI